MKGCKLVDDISNASKNRCLLSRLWVKYQTHCLSIEGSWIFISCHDSRCHSMGDWYNLTNSAINAGRTRWPIATTTKTKTKQKKSKSKSEFYFCHSNTESDFFHRKAHLFSVITWRWIIHHWNEIVGLGFRQI